MARRRKPPPPRGPQLELAGELCVAFVNTAGERPDNRQMGPGRVAPRLRPPHRRPCAAWGWVGDRDALDSLLSRVLSSAFEVMAVARGRPHVRQCAAEGCRLFFVDRSPTGHRRWCEKKTCGHRAANLRYYHRRGKKERV